MSQVGTTQGDSLAMPMHGVAVVPLTRRLDGCCTQVWYADDSAAAGKITQVWQWWETLAKEGPRFGYFVNPDITWLVTKEAHLEAATSLFAGIGVNITSEGRSYLGAAIGL